MLLLLIIVIKHPTGLCQKTKGISVFWILLSPKVSRLSPYTHAHQHTRTSRTFCIFAVPRGGYTPSLVENLMSRGRRNKSQFWIVSSRLRPYSDFSKHSRKSHTVQCRIKSREKSPHMDLRSASTAKRNR